MLSTNSKQRRDSNLTSQQLQALSQLPFHKDPFFAVHQGLHATMADFMKTKTIPLEPNYQRGKCGSFSDCAAMSLKRLFHIDSKDIYCIQLSHFINGNTSNALLQQPLETLATDGNHKVLYIKNGMRFLPEKLEGDIFFDSTVGQFNHSDNSISSRSEEPLEYLKIHGGKNGEIMSELLHKRGYIKIPKGDEGAARLGIIIAAYRSKRTWLSTPPSVSPNDLIEGIANITSESLSVKLYDKETSSCPNRNMEWDTYENMFPPNKMNGDLCIKHEQYQIEYRDHWIKCHN